MKTAAMLIGFGGPTRPAEVRPFLDSVLKGVRIPQARYNEVKHHYDLLDGVSPYNAITFQQKKALENELLKRKIQLPVFVGFRHSSPSIADALNQMKAQGIQKAAGFILASLRSPASFEKYIAGVDEAKQGTRIKMDFRYTQPFHENLLFIDAQADEVSKVIQKIDPKESDKTFFIFSAHSIPTAMAQTSGYDKQFEKIAELIAKKLNISSWTVAYQSRSGNPEASWLEPSVEKTVQGLDTKNFKNVVLVSAGFLCDNVEVIYDLDVECRDLCKKLNLGYFRAKTVTDHPKFIRLVADLIELSLRGTK